MKKLLLILALVMTLGLFAVSAQADVVFTNNTLIETWIGSSAVNVNVTGTKVGTSGANKTWYDVIGATATYENYGGVLKTDGTLIIETNWKGASYYDGAAVAADLFIDAGADGSWDIAIGTRSGRQNNVYSLTAGYETSKTWNSNYWQSGGWVYGGRYGGTIQSGSPPNAVINDGNAKDVPVEAKATIPFDTTTVTWTNIAGSAPDYQLAIKLTGITGFDPNSAFAFLWATATCANDTAEAVFTAGNVPLPGAVLLLGAGLARLAAYARRRREEV